jgi:cob(I)alamin adenosyltransferase
MIVTPDFTGRLETEIVELERTVQLPDAFVIPGGTTAAAALDVGRTVLRRAERRIVALQQAGQLRNPEVLRYVNRLSDLVFMLARAEEGTAVKPLTGRRAARSPRSRAHTRPEPRRRTRA